MNFHGWMICEDSCKPAIRYGSLPMLTVHRLLLRSIFLLSHELLCPDFLSTSIHEVAASLDLYRFNKQDDRQAFRMKDMKDSKEKDK